MRSTMTLRRLILYGSLFTLVLAVAVVCRVWWAHTVVARICACMDRSIEIGFGPLGHPDELGREVRRLGDYEDWIHRATWDVAFRRIEEFEVYYPGRISGDLGHELLRFSGLRRVTIDVNDSDEPTEQQWYRICTQLRLLPELERLELAGMKLTDHALSPLVGHPRLRRLEITQSSITPAVVDTLVSLPALRELELAGAYQPADAWLTTPAGRAPIQTRLPHVTITFPE